MPPSFALTVVRFNAIKIWWWFNCVSCLSFVLASDSVVFQVFFKYVTRSKERDLSSKKFDFQVLIVSNAFWYDFFNHAYI